MKGKIRIMLKITRIFNVTVVSFIALMLVFIAASVNCEDEAVDPYPDAMFIKPDKIILNSESEVNDVTAQFPGVPSCPLGANFDAELTLSKGGKDLVLNDKNLISYHYCEIDDVLQVRFNRQAVQDLVGDEAGTYTATVTFVIEDEISLAGKDETVEMINPAKSNKE